MSHNEPRLVRVTDFPRVELPGVEVNEDVRRMLDEAEEFEAFKSRERVRFFQAFLDLGKRPARPQPKSRRKPTKHVKRMQRVKAATTALAWKEDR